MFTELSKLLDKINLSMTFSKKGDKISVTVLPKAKKDNDNLSNTPLVVCGTAEELDENLLNEIEKGIGSVVGYYSNADVVAAAAKEEKTEEEKVTSEKTTSKSTTKAGDDKKKPHTGAQKKVVEKTATILEKAGKEKDPDMVEYLRKQVIKSYQDAKFDQAEIDAIDKQFAVIASNLNGTGTSPEPEVKTEQVDNTSANDDDDPDPEEDVVNAGNENEPDDDIF